MQLTPDQMKKDEDDYAEAFDSDMKPAPEVSEDEAMGISGEAPTADQPPAEAAPVEGEQPAAEQTAEQPAGDTAAGGEVAGETQAEAVGEKDGEDETPTRDSEELEGATNGGAEGADGNNASVAPAAEEEGASKPMTEQQLRSWQGRLRKMQEDLDAKTAATGKPAGEVTGDALEAAADKANEAGDPEMAVAAEEAAEKVESGEMTAEQAMKQLAEDFGDDFVNMIKTIATHMAREAGSAAATEHVNSMRGDIDDIINHITDGQAKAHFKSIADKHPDFQEIGGSEGFAKFIGELPDTHRDEAKRVIANGSADEIIDLLDAYKASQEASEPGADANAENPVVDETQLDAAEGVRSRGMVLPDTPKPAADSYEAAWEELG